MRIYFDTIGCRLNQAEIELLASQFRKAGNTIVENAEQAEVVVINTCAVTAAAASDSREKARQAYKAGVHKIILTGCWATLEPQAAGDLPGVIRVVNNANKENIPAELLGLPVESFEVEPLLREPLPGIHKRTRAFIKVQDGCDNHCTYCVTRIARGEGRSEPVEKVIAQINAAAAGGVKEAVLSGVHLGSWGTDWVPQQKISDLIAAILARTDIQRLRLSSIEPWDLDENFFTLWQDPRMCRHLHLPLQSGSRSVLKRMARNTTPEAYARLVENARAVIPGLAVTTDIIVGFPGETEEEFQESLEFVKGIHFSGGHVFKYSARPGTAASRLPGRIHGKVAHERSVQMRQALAESETEFQSQFIGKTLQVLWESADRLDQRGWKMHGLSDNYLKITAWRENQVQNQVENVTIERVVGDTLFGSVKLLT